jgi:hypothetical protein
LLAHTRTSTARTAQQGPACQRKAPYCRPGASKAFVGDRRFWAQSRRPWQVPRHDAHPRVPSQEFRSVHLVRLDIPARQETYGQLGVPRRSPR